MHMHWSAVPTSLQMTFVHVTLSDAQSARTDEKIEIHAYNSKRIVTISRGIIFSPRLVTRFSLKRIAHLRYFFCGNVPVLFSILLRAAFVRVYFEAAASVIVHLS